MRNGYMYAYTSIDIGLIFILFYGETDEYNGLKNTIYLCFE